MEALGGDRLWVDRFIAQHAALVYYWTLILFFMFSPKNAYNFSELVENHASDTYAHSLLCDDGRLITLDYCASE